MINIRTVQLRNKEVIKKLNLGRATKLLNREMIHIRGILGELEGRREL